MIYADLKWIDYNIPNRKDIYLELLKPTYHLYLTLAIGEQGQEGNHYFYTGVYNTGWIKREKFLIEEHSIIVDLNDLDDLEKHIKSFVNNVSGETWDDIVNKLRKYFYWEYEDHMFVT